ncbi:MAG TPA: hypothetical protein VJN32_00690, partial [Dehalococcoidia bacterium]|nr:hypothetical protein [Dehalococcoidia bacterium]
MLRACNRLLRPAGRIAFYTIFIAPGLSEAAYRRAARAGPSAVTSRRREQVDLLRSAGFAAVREIDVTEAFLRSTQAWYQGRDRYAAQLAEAEGEASFRERQRDYRLQARAIEAGLLRRALF